MNVDFRGGIIAGANIQIDKGDVIYNARIIDCFIDDVENSPKDALVNCQLEGCKIRSEVEAAEFLASGSK